MLWDPLPQPSPAGRGGLWSAVESGWVSSAVRGWDFFAVGSPEPSLSRSFAASSWCQGVQLGALPSMMETTLSMMRLPLSVCSMTCRFSDCAKLMWAVCSLVGCSSCVTICSYYKHACSSCQGARVDIDGQDG